MSSPTRHQLPPTPRSWAFQPLEMHNKSWLFKPPSHGTFVIVVPTDKDEFFFQKLHKQESECYHHTFKVISNWIWRYLTFESCPLLLFLYHLDSREKLCVHPKWWECDVTWGCIFLSFCGNSGVASRQEVMNPENTSITLPGLLVAGNSFLQHCRQPLTHKARMPFKRAPRCPTPLQGYTGEA